MFREILTALRKEDLLEQALGDTQEMLSEAEEMFKTAMCKVMKFEETDIDIYEKDRKINRMEWTVRQKVLEHLVIGSGEVDVPAALILISAVVDIERIGDYTKNIIELADISPLAMIFEEEHVCFFKDIEAQIVELFHLTQNSYRTGNEKKGQRVMDMHWQISERCDKMLEHLASEQDLNVEHAVIYTLLARYLKRISSHLKNIASSVVNPFPQMGFRSIDEGNISDVG